MHVLQQGARLEVGETERVEVPCIPLICGELAAIAGLILLLLVSCTHILQMPVRPSIQNKTAHKQ